MIEFHPLANIFPLIEGEDFEKLVADVRQHGLIEPITLLGRQILDGRNRYRACVAAKILPESLDEITATQIKHFKQFVAAGAPVPTQDQLLDYVVSRNLHRRQMNDDQRRMVAARMVNLRAGRPAEDKSPQFAAISREQAAKLLTTDEPGVERARSVLAHAVSEVVEMVDAGRVTVAAAAEIAQQPVERQAEIVASLPRDAAGKLTPEVKKALAPIVKEIRAEKIVAKKERRAERELDVGRRIQQLPGNFFGVAIEDFEWHHAAWNGETGAERSPSMHYETAEDAQTPEAIVARCAERFACLADACILFKWTTLPHLAIALKVLDLQGFDYVTNLVWNKERSGDARGMGYWFTGEHEIVLVGTRGKVVPPAIAHFRSIFSAPVGGHSEKPDNLHEIIEFHWPNTPKVEFNARRARPGWRTWGYDAPPQSEAAE